MNKTASTLNKWRRAQSVAYYFLIMLVTSSCSHTRMEMAEFAKLPPFKGRVMKVEKIGFPERPTSTSGPDYRITVSRPDGTAIIITTIHTTLMTNDRLEKLVQKNECDLPREIVECEDKRSQ